MIIFFVGDYIIEFIVIDLNGCEVVEIFDLMVYLLLEIEIIVDGIGCVNFEIIFIVFGVGNNVEYEWVDDVGVFNLRIFFNELVGFNIYEVFGIDENGCVGFGFIDIEIVFLLEIIFELSDDEVCLGEEVIIMVVFIEFISVIDWNGVVFNN